MATVTKEALERIAASVVDTKSIDLCLLARREGLSWSKDIVPLLRADNKLQWFIDEIDAHLIELKHYLTNQILQSALGINSPMEGPQLTAIKVMFACIDEMTTQHTYFLPKGHKTNKNAQASTEDDDIDNTVLNSLGL